MGGNKTTDCMDFHGLKIRKAKEKDLGDIISIFMIEGKKQPYLHKLPKKKLTDNFKPALKRGEIWLAIVDEKIVGFIWGGFSSVSKKIVYIDDLWILKNYQEMGIGRKLLNIIEKYYKKEGVKKFRITSYIESKAFGFYKKLNYKPSKDLVLLEKIV